MEKSERKALKQELLARQKAQEMAEMPMSISQLGALLDSLDKGLGPCKHGMPLADAYMSAEGLDLDRCKEWLASKGGHCDCEILANLEDFYESLGHTEERPVIQAKPRPAPPKLPLVFQGSPLPLLPKPWKARQFSAKPYTLELRYGSGDDFWLRLVDKAMPSFTAQKTELIKQALKLSDAKGWEASVQEGGFVLPEGLQALTVRFTQFSPIYSWFFMPGASFHMLSRSDSVRFASDRRLLESLLPLLTPGQLGNVQASGSSKP